MSQSFERLNIIYWREGFGCIIEINLLKKPSNLNYKFTI